VAMAGERRPRARSSLMDKVGLKEAIVISWC